MDAIIDQYGYKEGLKTSAGEIISWPYSEPQPTQAEVDQLVADYNAKVKYKFDRIKEYPTVEDQLDMIYHDQVNGTTIWKDTIAAVKTKYPKPS